jgi:hypothetical protein
MALGGEDAGGGGVAVPRCNDWLAIFALHAKYDWLPLCWAFYETVLAPANDISPPDAHLRIARC